MINLREGDFDAFFETPFSCYGRNTPFVSPMKMDLRRALDIEKNPLYKNHARRTWYTAHENDRIVGRILVQIHDASNHLHHLKRASFGLFDCIDSPAVAKTLLDAAATWAKDRGCEELAGSFNLTITQIIGVVMEGYESPPYTYQEWTPPHIQKYLTLNGFEPFFPMRTFELDVRGFNPEILLADKQKALLKNSDWQFLPIRRSGFQKRLIEACEILNDGFANNAMFVPLTEEEFLFPCEGMMWIIDQHLSWTAYHRGQPVGVLLCIPDLNPFLRATDFRLKWSTPWHLLKFYLHRERASIIFFSVRQAYHGQGVNMVMLHHTISAMIQRGYTHLGISWISDTNQASHRQMQKIGATPLHRLHLFRKSL